MEKFFEITEKDLNPEEYIKKVLLPHYGGIVIFIGTVRNSSNGRDVKNLTYETDLELAERIMEKIFKETEEKWKNISVAVAHRIGKDLSPETITLIIATSSPHREEAYAANRYLLERIKEDLPIWKKEVFADGTEKWVGWPDKS